MMYLDFRNSEGRMCNHFYFALQAFIVGKVMNQSVKYIRDAEFHRNGLDEKMKLFGLEDYGVDFVQNISKHTVISNNVDFITSFHQRFGIDFSIDQIEEFITDTFVKTGLFQSNSNDDTVGLHVRNTDYFSIPSFNCFDRGKYLGCAISTISDKITKVEVFSDDIELVKRTFGNKLNKRFNSVTYSNGTDTEDFIRFACLKNKILWNSTYSYWAAFIGNVIYPDSYINVVAPIRFQSCEPDGNHLNPMWNILNV